MMLFIIGLLLVVVICLVYLFVEYNNFIRLKNAVKEAFATMDVYLKKRWDLIPNLVEVVKGYAKHESSTLENVVRLRSSAYDNMSESEKMEKNQELSACISELIAIAENYPDLKASESFNNLSNQLLKIEDDIVNSRKYYNAVIKNMNDKVLMFPSNIIANMFNFKEMDMFEAEAMERKNVKVEL